MRGARAKALRRADPERPNPGRKHGGVDKHRRRLELARAAWLDRQRFLADDGLTNQPARPRGIAPPWRERLRRLRMRRH